MREGEGGGRERESRDHLLAPRATLAAGGARRDNPRETLFNVGRAAASYELLLPRAARITRCSHAGCEHAPRARHRAGLGRAGVATISDRPRRFLACLAYASSRLAALHEAALDFSSLTARRGAARRSHICERGIDGPRLAHVDRIDHNPLLVSG